MLARHALNSIDFKPCYCAQITIFIVLTRRHAAAAGTCAPAAQESNLESTIQVCSSSGVLEHQYLQLTLRGNEEAPGGVPASLADGRSSSEHRDEASSGASALAAGNESSDPPPVTPSEPDGSNTTSSSSSRSSQSNSDGRSGQMGGADSSSRSPGDGSGRVTASPRKKSKSSRHSKKEPLRKETGAAAEPKPEQISKVDHITVELATEEAASPAPPQHQQGVTASSSSGEPSPGEAVVGGSGGGSSGSGKPSEGSSTSAEPSAGAAALQPQEGVDTSITESAPSAEEAAAATASQPEEGGSISSSPTAEDAVYVAICLAAKGERAGIREWVAYHRSIGVERFYVYDHGSEPPFKDVLEDFIQSGLVVYRFLDGAIGRPGERPQLAIYNDCIQQHRTKSTWLGAIDADEFVVIRDGSPSLPDVLKRYEGYGGLAINWRLFGSSGHASRPAGGMLQGYTKCSSVGYPENIHVKSFANTAHVAQAGWSPHHFDYQPGYFAVNTNFTRVDGPFSAHPPLADVLSLHHYALRSAEEFQLKLAKGSAMGPDIKKTTQLWDRVEAASTETCLEGVALGAKIQEELGRLQKDRRQRQREKRRQ